MGLLFARFVRPIKLAMLRDYRKRLPDSPGLNMWNRNTYIPPEVRLGDGGGEAASSDEQWKTTFDLLLKQSRGRLWLVQGESGLGKTALLQMWTRYCLERGLTPILIRLGGGLSPRAEAASLMAQYGDVHVKEDVALDLLAGGGFVILLDGFNEDRNPSATREFVRRVLRRNLVVLTSQFQPDWGRVFNMESVELKPFGEEQLAKLIPSDWLQPLLQSSRLREIARRPATAILLAEYIQRNGALPELRLEIFADLRARIGADTLLLNLEEQAWELFKSNQTDFESSKALPRRLCQAAVEAEILTVSAELYRFSHELIHRYFAALWLDRQDPRPLLEWYGEAKPGLGRDYWTDLLDLWGEMYGMRAVKSGMVAGYVDFLKECGEFSKEIFRRRLYPLYDGLCEADLVKRNNKFDRWSLRLLTGTES